MLYVVIALVNNSFNDVREYFEANSDSISSLESHNNKQVASKATEVREYKNYKKNKNKIKI